MTFDAFEADGLSIGFTGPELRPLLAAAAARPWVPLRLDETSESIVDVPADAFVALSAPTGFGKSSLAIQLAETHARTLGPVVFVSLEMSAAEVAGRIVSQGSGESWRDVLTGRAEARSVDLLDGLPRFRVLDGTNATIAGTVAALARAREDHPGELALVVVDYLQILPASTADLRVSTATNVERLRALAKELQAVVIAISQVSRSGSRDLREGNRVGAETIDAGAETSQIERAAYVTLTLGTQKRIDDRESTMDLSVGKERMGRGDTVRALRFNGPSGRFTSGGTAVAGETVRRERAAENALDTIEAILGDKRGGIPRDELVPATGMQRQRVLAAVTQGIAAGRLREVGGPGRAKVVALASGTPN